ncbi:hypothetical protein D3C75_561370 [compost metagenome]
MRKAFDIRHAGNEIAPLRRAGAGVFQQFKAAQGKTGAVFWYRGWHRACGLRIQVVEHAFGDKRAAAGAR